MSHTSLALKYRPRRFAEVVGQRTARLVLQRLIQKNQIHVAYVFHGSFGCGKTTMARLFAAALNCEHEDVKERPCGKCSTCEVTAEGRSADVTEIDAASNGGVDDIRALRERVRYAAQGRYRVVILDEAHSLSSSGFDALLKTLEEPPPDVVFILATTDLNGIQETVRSRCFSCEFKRISDKQLAARIKEISEAEDFEFSAELCLAIATRAKGVARDAVMLAEQAALVRVRTPDQLVQLLGEEDHGLRVLQPLMSGPDYPAAFEAASQALAVLPSVREVVSAVVVSLKRLLVLTVSEDGATLSPPPTAAERALAASTDSARCVAGLRVVWEYLRSVAPAVDAGAALDLVVTLLGQAIGSGQTRRETTKKDLASMVRG